MDNRPLNKLWLGLYAYAQTMVMVICLQKVNKKYCYIVKSRYYKRWFSIGKRDVPSQHFIKLSIVLPDRAIIDSLNTCETASRSNAHHTGASCCTPASERRLQVRKIPEVFTRANKRELDPSIGLSAGLRKCILASDTTCPQYFHA